MGFNSAFKGLIIIIIIIIIIIAVIQTPKSFLRLQVIE